MSVERRRRSDDIHPPSPRAHGPRRVPRHHRRLRARAPVSRRSGPRLRRRGARPGGARRDPQGPRPRPAAARSSTSRGSSRAVQGDLGRSFQNKQQVSEAILERLPATFELGLAALTISITFALIVGILSAVKRNSVVDLLSSSVTLMGVSFPSFFLGIVLILLFAYVIPGASSRPAATSRSRQDAGENLRRLVLPAVTLATASLAVNLRQVRSSLLDVFGPGLRADRPREGTARADGRRAPRAQERAHPGRHACRHPDRRDHRGRGHHRDDLLVAGRRAARGPGDPRRTTTRSSRAWCWCPRCPSCSARSSSTCCTRGSTRASRTTRRRSDGRHDGPDRASAGQRRPARLGALLPAPQPANDRGRRDRARLADHRDLRAVPRAVRPDQGERDRFAHPARRRALARDRRPWARRSLTSDVGLAREPVGRA